MSLTNYLQSDLNALAAYISKRTDQLEAEYWAAIKGTTPEFELQERARNEYRERKIYTEEELEQYLDEKER